MIHDAYQTAVFWIEHKYHTFKSYWGEAEMWILFGVSLALLCFFVGFAFGFIYGKL